MSQSHHAESDHRGELDPLLAFNAEFAAAASPGNPVDPQTPAAEEPSSLRARVDQAERSLDRARIEIASLKSDLATLVAAVDDIRKRLSRRPEATVPLPVVKRPRQNGLGTAAKIVLFVVALVAAIGGGAAVALMEIPVMPAVGMETGEAARPSGGDGGGPGE